MILKFNPTPEQIRTAENCFLMFEYEKILRPIVEGYEREILERHQWNTSPVAGMPKFVVLEPKDAYFLSVEDFAVYATECQAAALAHGLTIDKAGDCPLLVAETTIRKAATLLIHALGEIPGLETFKDTRYMLRTHRERAVELAFSLFSPYIRSFEELKAEQARGKG